MPSGSELETISNGLPPLRASDRDSILPVGDSGLGFKVLVLLGDLIAGSLAIGLTSWLASPPDEPLANLLPAWLLLCLFWVLGLVAGRLYTFRPSRDPLVWAVQVIVYLGGGTLAAIAVSFLIGGLLLLDNSVYAGATLLAWPLVFAVRAIALRLGPSFHVRDRVIVLGTAGRARTLIEALQGGHNPVGAVLIGAVRLPGEPHVDLLPCPVLGDIAEGVGLVRRHQANLVVVATAFPAPAAAVHCAAHCDAMGVGVWTMETAYEELTWRTPVWPVGETWLANLESVRRSRYASRLKRYCDVGFTLAVMPLTLVIIGLSAALIKLLSPGPIFYRQERVGRDGATFQFLKLRTMVVDAEKHTGPVWATEDDPRVTPVGRFLRRTRLDELPQLFLVLRGDMSLIGPRPERPFFVRQFEGEIPFYEKRLAVRPGVTGWAQVHHSYDRNTDDVIEKLRYDLYYIRHLSLSMDLQIVLKTIAVMLRRQGAL